MRIWLSRGWTREKIADRYVRLCLGAIRALGDHFKSVTLKQRRLELWLQDEAVNTAALSAAFGALTENKVSLVSVRSVGAQTEQAFLDLVEKEESRGFARLYQGEAA